jgi:hypothetical protein
MENAMDKNKNIKTKTKAKTKTKNKTKIKTIPWDSAKLLETKEDIAGYLEAVLEDADPALITHALGVIARSKGMTQIGRAGQPRARKPVQGAIGGGQSGICHGAEGDPRVGTQAEGGGVVVLGG